MNRALDIRLSHAARRALESRQAPLLVELELYFSCLIRKRVLFPEGPHEGALTMHAGEYPLRVYFRPVMTQACSVDEAGDSPALEAFPIVKPEAFRPRWLALDLRHGRWQGEFGYR